MRKLALVAGGGIAIMWSAAALGSYVYLTGMGYPGSFTFPWIQVWLVLPWLIDAKWAGMASVTAWMWEASGLICAVMPVVMAISLAVRRISDRRSRPRLHGETGWASRREMTDNGIRSDRNIF